MRPFPVPAREVFYRSRRARRGLPLASRVTAAVIGAYGVTWLATMALSLLLFRVGGVARVDAAVVSMLAGLLIYPVTAIAVLRVRNATWAWLWLAGAAASLGLIVTMLSPEALP